MEIMTSTTTTSPNAHNQKELRLFAPSGTTTTAGDHHLGKHGARSPFQREVREWQRIDPDTGALMTGRLEADRWVSGPLNSYGKISDSQNISQPNGTQQTQRKQIEVIQRCTSGGAAMQVIRSQTVQTTSSRWSSPSSSATASPSPTSALLQQTLNSSAVRDIHSQSSQKQKQHKNHNTNSTSSASATNTTTKSPFRATNGFLQQHQQQKTKTNQSTTTKFQPSREIGTKTTRTTTTTTTNTTKSKSSTSSSSAKPLASPLNGKRNWPQIVVENMSSTLDICDNDDDNEHVHDNDYIVEDASGGDDDDVDEEEHHDVNGGHRENHHHFHSPQNITLVDHDDDEDDYHHRFNGETLDDEDDRFFAKPQHPNNTSTTTTGFSAFKSLGLNANNATTTLHDDDHDSHVNGNADNDDYHPHHHQHHQQQQHPRYELQNGHSSSSCSSLNSHNGNSCTNGNQLFLLDTAPSLKLSNLMKSSSSISNSSNNSTTAMQNETTTTTTTTTTTNFNSNLNKNSNSSMNTHKSMAGKNISLHAIVGNNNNHHHPSIGDRTTKTTASLTPSPTTTTTRPSWQQPTIFRQNGNNTPPHSPLTSQRGSRGQTAQHSTSSTPSSSHSSKSRVGDNNCCGSSGSGSGSSDESRPHTTAELRHQQPQPQHQSQRQREQSLPSSQHEQRQSPPSALYQLKPQNDRLTPTQSVQLRPQQHSYNRVDLESFRHYGSSNNNNNIITSHHITSDTYANDSAPALSTDHQHHHHHSHHNDDDGDGLRLSSRHLRRQQIPRDSDYSAAPSSLHRSRSISTDDLSTDWDINGVDNEEPAEWRRVSKLRRSFQNSGSTKIETTIPPPRRPLDLPESSVSVSKIRAELENGRRLNTVMKNNHVDLAALSSILNGPDNKPVSPSLSSTRSSFLTAESLKEIRGKLKRLSDESLYKEDFIISQQTNAELPEQEHIEVQPSTIRKSVEKSPERYTSRSTERREEEPAGKHNTNSLESRLKFKETNPTEWHLRRKSYGFEKMSPPDKTSMQRMDASTDSGLGRSGELQNWSPTTQDSNRTVVVRLGENSGTPRSSITGLTSSSSVHRRFRQQKSYDESENSPEEEMAPNKRHSIAVDDRDQYVRDNGRQTTQVRLNGFYERNSPLGEGKFVQTSEMLTTSSGGFSQKVQQKRVEFCKTEVHFATESGRVNIVETDSKPPPTNNFRRRRSRSSSVGPLQSLVKSATTVSTTSTASSSSVAMPVTLFGDDKLRRKTIASTTVAYRAPLVDSPEPDKQIAATPAIKNVTVTTVAESYGNSESSRSSYASTSGVDTTDYETDEMTSLRGILKNKPAKPKPYVLGENIDKPDELWGVQSIKSMKGPGETRGPNDSPLTIPAPQNMASIKSVAERIQDLSQTNGFSTKINLNVGNGSSPVTVPSAKNWEENDLPNSNVMSIKLHSPQATTEIPTAVKPLAPVAKPRTVSSNAETKPTTATTTTQPHKPYQTSLPTKDSLKIIKEARGARQLRDHELSYFGIAASKVEQEKLKTKYPMISSSRNSPKRSLPLRRVSEEMAGTNGRHDKENGRSSPHNKWQLDHDKPDLLKHNPPMRGEDGTAMPIKPAERTSLKKKAALDEEEEHLYENIANDITPVFKVKEVYDRKLDLQRDAMILSEMNESADQTLRELSDEASLKDRKRRSLPRRNSKPLETIDEKAMTEKISDTCIAVKVSRGTFASEAKKTSRHNTPSPNRLNSAPRERTSSQSSVECCPRARSRSLSSEKEYENLKTSSKSSRSTQMVKHKSHKPQTERRSSSLDSQRSYHSQYSSGEEQQQQQQLRNSFRREDRSRAKTKRPTNTSSSSSKSQRCEEKTSSKLSSSAHHSEFKRSSSTTRSSTHRERAECHKGDTNGHTDSQHNKRERDRDRDHHHSGTSSLQRGSAISSSGRRHRDELRDSQRLKRSTATSDKSSAARHEKAEGSGKHSSSRLARDDERNNSTRSSSHRLERSSGDKEKEKLSKSKAHSSRSTSQQRHERSATTITTTTTSSHTTTAPSSSNDPDRHHSRSGSKTKAVTSTENTTQSKNSQQRQQQQQQQHHHHRPNHSSSASSSKERSREHAKDPTLVSERKQKSAKTPTEVITKTHEHVYGLKSAIIKTTTKLREKSRARKEKK
ncbi:mucin-4 isoform X3 [Musca domestica]|uniref:Mucin-4 isoform X3 n=1 Tax=Musca domestica TaxID=7370 RepID=A0ABM3V5P9_MUSDO|nr:mucin-4 isoform X3 [Musca domestica]